MQVISGRPSSARSCGLVDGLAGSESGYFTSIPVSGRESVISAVFYTSAYLIEIADQVALWLKPIMDLMSNRNGKQPLHSSSGVGSHYSVNPCGMEHQEICSFKSRSSGQININADCMPISLHVSPFTAFQSSNPCLPTSHISLEPMR